MKYGYFDSPVYDTPQKERMSLAVRLKLNSRFWFTFRYAVIVFRTRKQARKGIYDDKAWADSSYYIFRFIEETGGVFHITGMDNIVRSPEPVLFIGNHMSTLETMVLPGLISPLRRVTFVVKEGLVKHPLFKDVMLSRDPIIVGRTDPRKDLEAVMNGGMDLLSRGISVVIFPQSTRSIEFRPEDFNSLGVKLAKKAGVKVVPVALKTDFWGNGRIIKELGPIDRSKHIYLKFGEPFEVKGSGKDENQKIIDFIRNSLAEWKNIP
ncbi:MAG: 1-acyl-sn-glycerol-3-phosphate acyltransferase [Bacteroidales bacterium]|jgi:1-acyl-sn-glycerol-3-phosphate acyltransferase|nr:1-acyl-sn-glycerol-3-phosphate acyltransferase [Bacteroidales bacterium]